MTGGTGAAAFALPVRRVAARGPGFFPEPLRVAGRGAVRLVADTVPVGAALAVVFGFAFVVAFAVVVAVVPFAAVFAVLAVVAVAALLALAVLAAFVVLVALALAAVLAALPALVLVVVAAGAADAPEVAAFADLTDFADFGAALAAVVFAVELFAVVDLAAGRLVAFSPAPADCFTERAESAAAALVALAADRPALRAPLRVEVAMIRRARLRPPVRRPLCT